jgi:aminoglycoside phosphotransferase (APT) family kinase protein
MDQIATGRDCDVYLLDDRRILRRMRHGVSTEAEAETMWALADAGYPVPRVYSAVGQDMVMERIDGPSLAQAVFSGALSVSDGGALLARLHHDLHALPWPGGEPLLHMDLHPLNVLMSDNGPVVIDWTTARPGPAGLDVAYSALVCAQVVTTPGIVPGIDDAERRRLGEFLEAFGTAAVPSWRDFLVEAVELRRWNPNTTAAERAALDRAGVFAARVGGATTEPRDG